VCGIVGFLSAQGAEAPDRERLARAVAALRHRGPDASSVYAQGRVALGHTRLSIIDVEGGSQPFANEDGSIVTVYNGEIWNHELLRRELEQLGHRFRTRCDTEVLVHGYEEWQDALPERLEGMFAFAIWDSGAERLFLARDRVGKKPLYVSQTDRGLAFGSDARSILLATGRAPELQVDAVGEFLFQRYVGAPRTMFHGIDRLRPGHQASYDGRDYRERAYWSLQPREERPLGVRELRGLLLESVRARLMSDVPLGILLSGGVDSAAVLGLMREAGAEAIASFTIGFDDPLFDERPLARLAATRNGTDHHEIVIDETSFHEPLGRLAWFRDEPIAEASEVPLLLLAEEVGKHVKVVLSGDGGDELYGGYPKYVADRLLRLPLPGRVRLLRLAGAALERTPTHRRIDRALETFMIDDTVLRWASWFRSFSPAELRRFLRPELGEGAATLAGEHLRALLAPYGGLDPGRKMLVGDFLTYLPDNMLLRSDKVLMGASVEGRTPLLDHRVVERVSDVSARQRVRRRTPKALFRDAVSDLVPEPILSGVKRGFPVPTARFLLDSDRSPLRAMLRSERFADRGLFQGDALAALADGLVGESNRELKLFTVASLELWLRTNVDQVRESPPSSLEELLDPPELDSLRAVA
jgi:asparagine synthase (glutamine-hydrolysing)